MIKKLVLVMLLLSSMVYAIDLNGIRLESVGLNTNVSINGTVSADLYEIDISGNHIYFENLTVSTGTEYLKYNLNITESNKDYIFNSSRKDLPYISASSSTSKTITATNFSVNSTVVLDVTGCSADRIGDEVNFVTVGGTQVTTSCLSSTQIIIQNYEFPTGDTTFLIDYVTQQENGCNQTANSATKILTWLAAIAVIITIGFFAQFIYSYLNNEDLFFDTETLLSILLIVGMTAVVLGIAAAVTVGVCSI